MFQIEETLCSYIVLAAPVVSQATGPYQSSSAMLEPAYIYQPDSSSVPGNPVTSSTLSSWNFNSTPPVAASQVTKGFGLFLLSFSSCFVSSRNIICSIFSNIVYLFVWVSR
jgi:hypothetical protein